MRNHKLNLLQDADRSGNEGVMSLVEANTLLNNDWPVKLKKASKIDDWQLICVIYRMHKINSGVNN